MHTTAPESPASHHGASPTDTAPTFATLGLREELCLTLDELGYTTPTPIQSRTIARLLAGADVIAQAQTGTGKTAAFALPILQQLDPESRQTQALVLAPTRELAVQVAKAISVYGKRLRISVLAVYGGQAISQQLRPLSRGAQVVVGTPGRLLDHIRRGTLRLGAVRTVVLDEADEMLDMGFIDDIQTILQETPPERQTALFSATMPGAIVALSRKYLRDPQRVTVSDEPAAGPQIRQAYYDVGRRDKFEVLLRLLQHETPASSIIFCRTRGDADALGERLTHHGVPADSLHGDLSQLQRDRVMARFRSGQVGVLAATDVAARGLDIQQVSHVINFDLPVEAGVYIHRIGRTGRAGRTGSALTLLSPGERNLLRAIERLTGGPMQRLPVPTLGEVAVRRHEAFKGTLRDALGADPGPYRGLAQDLLGEHPPAELLAAALRLLLGPAASEGADLLAAAEPDLDERRSKRPQRSDHSRERFTRHEHGPRREFSPRGEHAPSREFSPRGEHAPSREFSPRGEHAPSREFSPRGEHAPSREHPPSGVTTLFLNIGRDDGVRAADLVGAIANEAGLSGRAIGAIQLFGSFCTVEVPSVKAGHVMQALRNTFVRGRKVAPSLAQPG